MTDNNGIVYMQCFPVTVTPKGKTAIDTPTIGKQQRQQDANPQNFVVGASTLQDAVESQQSDTLMLSKNVDGSIATQQQLVMPAVIPVQVSNLEPYTKNTDAKVRMQNSTHQSMNRNAPPMF